MKQLLSGYAVDQDYIERLVDINTHGDVSANRTGVDSVSLFGESARFNLRNGRLPVSGFKSQPLSTITHELIWFLSGDTRIKYLKENNVNIWDSWVDPATRVFKIDSEISKFTLDEWFSSQYPDKTMKQGDTVEEMVANNYPLFEPVCPLIDGDLPNVYQSQWFKWEDTITLVAEEYYANPTRYSDLGYVHQGTYNCTETEVIKVVLRRYINQYQNVINTLKTDPSCRRMIVEGWNVGKIDQMALPPCHKSIQFYTSTFNLQDRIAIYKDSKGVLTDPTLVTLETDELKHEYLDDLDIPRMGLSSMLYMRSSDHGVGYNFNIVQYAILTHIIGKMTGLYPLDFIWVGADVHVYMNQWQYTSEKGTEGGVSELIHRFNAINTEDDQGTVYTPIVDTHEEAILNSRTLQREIVYPFVKLSDRIATLGATELSAITYDDIEFTEYVNLGPCPFPKAAV